MDSQYSQPRQRRPRITLTRRQREVMAAIADGKTNGQIADDLGISLDGVKYHVREIFALLGVDTREEATEWWRQQHGMRARMSVVSNLVRMPALIRFGLLGGGAAGAVAGIAVVVAMAGSPDRVDSPLDPGVWTVLAEPVGGIVCEGGSPEDPMCQASEERLIILDETGAERRELGDVANWGALRWSPNGSLVAALEEIPTPSGVPDYRIHVFNLATDEHFVREMAGDTGCCSWAWSPDSTRLAISSNHGLLILDDALSAIAHYDSAIGHPGDPEWASDSSRLALARQGQVRIFTRDGRPVAAGAVIQLLPGFDISSDKVFTRVDELEGDELHVLVSGSPITGSAEFGMRTVRIAGAVRGDSIVWRPQEAQDFSDDPASISALRLGVDYDLRRKVALEAGYHGSAGAGVSSDGALVFAELSDSFQGSRPAIYPRAIGWASEDIAGHIDITDLPFTTSPSFDVVLVKD